MTIKPSQELQSDALKANLLETAVSEVTIDPVYSVLFEVVRDYRGIQTNLEGLLYEISHPFRNWKLLLPRLRSFVLKNSDKFQGHPNGPAALERFVDLFLLALEGSGKNTPPPADVLEALLAGMERFLPRNYPELRRYEESLSYCFARLFDLDDKILMGIVQGHHPVKKIAASLNDLSKQGESNEKTFFDIRPVARLLQRILALNYQYWLDEEDPQSWFFKQCNSFCNGWEAGKLLQAISHQRITEHKKALAAIEVESSPPDMEGLLTLPAHIDFVRLYKKVPSELVTKNNTADKANEESDRFTENRKLLFLFRIMETSGLFLIHEETLREINRSLVHLIRQQTFEEIESFLLTTLHLLKENVRRYPHTSLQCIQVLGSEVFKRGNSRLVETFLWEVVRFGFQYSHVIGVDENWQPIANPAHLANIRVWLNLIMQEPKWCSTLFSALIINIHLSGTCIKDTDLFQRDISRLLNHPVAPVYNLVKQFTKLMPVFYNEIGAEGFLRDVSTEVDEIHHRKDPLIHFLRKQSHVESSNLIVEFIEAIFRFWTNGNPDELIPYLPEEVLANVLLKGPMVDDLKKIMERIYSRPDCAKPRDLLSFDENQLHEFLAKQDDLAKTETRRFSLLIKMYKLLFQKYNLGFQALKLQLEQAAKAGFPEMKELYGELQSTDNFVCLEALLSRLESLKEVILSDEVYEAREDIYYKRHIAVDIPSVYGRYREKKFDALGLSFRLENLTNIYLEKLPQTVNLTFITRATFVRIIKCLELYLRALAIDGITSRKLETYLSLLAASLEVKRFSYTQYLDIFQGLSEGVKDVIYAYYTNIHQSNLSIIIPRIGRDNLLSKYHFLWQDEDPAASGMKLSESFLRDHIAGTFGLQHLDNFITRIYQTLESQKKLLGKSSLDLLMTYAPGKAISFLNDTNPQANDLIHLGNKGFNLNQLCTAGKPVPPGFIITTEIFRCWPVIKEFTRARDELLSQVRLALTVLEEKTGRKFGDPDNPLLLSVRSGAAISMPGMMATIHNVGLNRDLADEFTAASGLEYPAWDNYRRFLQSWAMTEGLEREVFQSLMNKSKERYGIMEKKEFSSAQMRELALEYEKNIRNVGIGIPEDPWLQLTGAIEMVLNSWNAAKTEEYRAIMNISDSWGTAVIVQTMVFGNLGPHSGSGVVFTAHPYRKVRRVALWGDYAPGDQGEDIVSGLVTTYPISVEQAEIDGRSIDNTLEVKFPETYETLLTMSRELIYEKGWNPQEIEFTFEGPEAKNLYILQTRDMVSIEKKERFQVFSINNGMLERNTLGKGIGVSGGALSGKAVFTAENIAELREKEPETPLILIRQDTVPEDIKEISLANGLLTSRGGQTSHASVVAVRMEKTCVVGCNALKVYEAEERAEIGDHTIRFCDAISLDGRTGLLLKGTHPVREEIHILPI